MNDEDEQPQAGSSRRQSPSGRVQSGETMTIPSTGLEFFEYRRHLFLAGLPLPSTPTDLPTHYTRLETLLAEPGAEETELAWRAGVGGVLGHLNGGKRLSKPLRLGLVIKILRAGWLREGIWPIDPLTSRAIKPPDSPLLEPSSPDTPQIVPDIFAGSAASVAGEHGNHKPLSLANFSNRRHAGHVDTQRAVDEIPNLEARMGLERQRSARDRRETAQAEDAGVEDGVEDRVEDGAEEGTATSASGHV
ncbi:hypothetical protein EHS25_003206 [Saitozyma podzolica]|uniref:Uncharacterized protein n=1 Tax=Saitozyma podzolica TaxID=1890683 RepID=A0A427Y8D0_9TREE|nr:hypothetical protein EHS25_003206 [Saitozyma podzolica]